MLIIAALYVWRHTLIGPVVIRQIQRVAAEQSGLQLRIGATGGDYLETFGLLDLTIEPDPALGVERASIARIEVRYSLLDLLRGVLWTSDGALEETLTRALDSVRVTGADLALDVGLLAGLVDLDELDLEWPDPADVPAVVVEDTRLHLRLGQDTLDVEGLAVDMPRGVWTATTEGVVQLSAGRSRVVAALPARPPQADGTPAGPELVELSLPSWNTVVARRDDLLELRRLTSEGATLLDRVALGVDAILAGDVLLEAEAPIAGGRARLAYATAAGRDHLELDVQAAQLPAVRSLVDALGLSSLQEPARLLPDSGGADLVAALDIAWQPTLEVTGTLDLRAHGLKWADTTAPGVGSPDADITDLGLAELLSRGVDDLSVGVVLEPDALTLALGDVHTPDLHVDLAGTRLAWAPSPAVDLELTGEVQGDTFPAGRPVTLQAHGARDDDGSWRVPSLLASGTDFTLTLDGLVIMPGIAAGPATGTAAGNRTLQARLEYAHLEADLEQGTADLHGLTLSWDEAAHLLVVELQDAQVGARGQLLALTAPTRLSWERHQAVNRADAGTLRVDSMEWAGAGGSISIRGMVDTQGDEADLSLVAREIRPAGLIRAFVPQLPRFGLLELLEVEAHGPPDQLVTTLSLRVLGVEGVAAQTMDVDLHAQHSSTAVELDRLAITVHERVVAKGSARMTLVDGLPQVQDGAWTGEVSGELGFALEGAPDLLGELPFDSPRLGGQVTVRGAWPQPEVLIALHGDALQPPGVDLPAGAHWPDLRAEVRFAEGVLELTGLTLDSGALKLTASGRCVEPLLIGEGDHGLPTLALDLDAPLEGRLDVSGEDSAMLVSAVAGVRRATGRVDAALRIDGTLGNPRLLGPLTLTGGELAMDTGGVASVTGLQASASFDAPLTMTGASPVPGIVVRDIQVVGELGASPFELVGEVSWAPSDSGSLLSGLQADLSLDGTELLLYRAGGLKVRGNTHLEIRGPYDTLTVSGSVAITDGRMTRHISLLDLGTESTPMSVQLDRVALKQPPFAAMRMDVSVSTLVPMRVSNRLIRADARLDARVRGTGAEPQLTGNLIIERGQIELPLWTFLVDRAGVVFDPRNLLGSELTGTARARMLGYDVLAILSGPLEQPEVRLSSLPPMPEEDLLNLVLTGQLPTEGAFAEDSRVLTGVAIYLGKDLLERAFGDESTESSESFLSRFEVETGRNQSRTGSETLDVRFRILDNVFTNDDAVYLEVEQSEFDETNGSLRFVFRLE